MRSSISWVQVQPLPSASNLSINLPKAAFVEAFRSYGAAQSSRTSASASIALFTKNRNRH